MTIVLPSETIGDVVVEMLSLENLVAAKKTQRDKDWPMIRRLVYASYAVGRDGNVTDYQAAFWMAQLRSPEFLHELVERFPEAAVRSDRPAVGGALGGGDVAHTLAAEQAREMAEDATYWRPLRRELEALRHASRRQ